MGSISINETFKSVVLIGKYQETLSPLKTDRQMLLMTVEGDAQSKASLMLKKDWEYLLYCCEGSLNIDHNRLQTGEGLFTEKMEVLDIEFIETTKAVLMGGPVLDEKPRFEGSLVAVNTDEMELYKQRLRNGDFGTHP